MSNTRRFNLLDCVDPSRECWIWHAQKLVEKFGSPGAIFHTSLAKLESCGLCAASAQVISRNANLPEAEKEI